MQKYEMMLMLFPDLGEKGTTEAISEVKELLESLGGSIFDEDVWGVRDLAYRIKKQDQGYYIVWNLDFPGKNISELEKNLNINQSVMRYLMVRTPVNYELKTLAAYQAEAEEAEKERAAEKAEKDAKKKAPAPKKKTPAKKAAPKKEAVAEETPKEEKAEKDAKLEDVDAKLKSIIEDPDISL